MRFVSKRDNALQRSRQSESRRRRNVQPVDSKTRTYHGRAASGRTAESGQGRAGLFANRTVRLGNNPSSHHPKYRRHVAWTSVQKHEQAKSYVNRWRNKTRGWTAVHPRFISGLSAGREALFRAGCRPVERRLFVSVNPFHARHVRENNKNTERRGLSRVERQYCPSNRSSRFENQRSQILFLVSSIEDGTHASFFPESRRIVRLQVFSSAIVGRSDAASLETYSLFLNRTFRLVNSRTCLAWKEFTKTKKRRSTGQQPGRKSACGPGDT